MSINKTEIFNMALSNIGEHTITNSDASSTEKASVICNRYYDICLKMLMKEVDWPFVTTQAKLTRSALTKTVDSDTVNIEFNKDFPFVFDIPSDCINIERIFIGKINEELDENFNRTSIRKHYKELKKGVEWKIYYVPQKDAPKIVCKEKEDVNIEYTKFVEDVTDYQPYFVDALCWLLSSRIAMPITKDPQKVSMCLQMYQESLKNAKLLILNEQGTDDKSFIPNSIKARIGVKDTKYYR